MATKRKRVECITTGGVAPKISRSRRPSNEAFSRICHYVSGITGRILLRHSWHRECSGQHKPLLCLRKAMAVAREDAVTSTGSAGRQYPNPESYAVRDLE